ncbi:related to glycosyl transferase [Rhynchosporium secalis]|uniref:Related to glycosyl transferase n=1 Tax=Rhynchosporium secalis TaxID=38038 RepID=A0A1E1MBD7_RHYSE|nr:related to glycosyl transferase [Rhynchosporium secalis]
MFIEERVAIRTLEVVEDTRTAELPRDVVVIWHPLVARICIVTWRLYMALRFYLLVTSRTSSLLQWGFLFAEWSIAMPCEDSQRLTIAAGVAAQSKPRRPLLRAIGSNLPSIDVLIPCCGESHEIILNTVKAACMLDYPVQQLTVALLDDGNSPQLRTAVAELAKNHANVRYVARGKKANYVFSKAGNLNHTLLNVQGIDWPAAEYVAVFDADFIPEPQFLRATLPHLLRSSKVAMVSTPQHFYNLPATDPLLQALDYGTSILEPIQDRRGFAVCSGSGFLFRRDAVLQVGCFPTSAFNEDHLLTALLLRSNWEIIHTQEPLQFGLVPDSMEGHIGQRQRWSLGVVQMVNILRAKHLTASAAHRREIAKEGFMFGVYLMQCVFTMAIVPIALLSDQQLVSYSAKWELKTVLILALLYHTACWVHEYVTAISSNFLCSTFPHLNQVWLTIPQLMNLTRYYTFTLLGRRDKVMPRPTFSSGTSWAALSPTAQAKPQQQQQQQPQSQPPSPSSIYRLKRLLFHSGLLVHVLLFFLVPVSLFLSLRRTCTSLSICPAALQKAAFPPAIWLSYVVVTQCYVPVSHLLKTTVWPERESMLVQREPGGVLYPSLAARDRALHRRKERVGAGGHFLVVLGVFLAVAVSIWRL